MAPMSSSQAALVAWPVTTWEREPPAGPELGVMEVSFNDQFYLVRGDAHGTKGLVGGPQGSHVSALPMVLPRN